MLSDTTDLSENPQPTSSQKNELVELLLNDLLGEEEIQQNKSEETFQQVDGLGGNVPQKLRLPSWIRGITNDQIPFFVGDSIAQFEVCPFEGLAAQLQSVQRKTGTKNDKRYHREFIYF